MIHAQRKPRWLVTLLLVALIAALAGGRASAQTVPGGMVSPPGITIAPKTGTQFQSFTFQGAGFAPGTPLEVTFFGPSGAEFQYFFGDVPALLIADTQGGFTLTVLPTSDFAGARVGTWQARICVREGDACYEGEFEISLG